MRFIGRFIRTTAGRRIFGQQGLVCKFRYSQTFCQFERGFQTVGEAGRKIGAHNNAIYDHIDIMLVLLIECGDVSDFVESAVHLDALEALLLQLRQFLFIFALTTTHDGGQNEKTGAFLKHQDAVNHLADRLAFNR